MVNNNIIKGFDDDNDENLKIRLRKIPELEKGLVLIFSGYIDTYNAKYFNKKINMVIEAGYTKLIFYCKDLNYVSSTGIGSFVTFLKQLKAKGGDIVLFDVQLKVLEVFQLLGFSQFFAVKENYKDSIEYFLTGAAVDEKTSLFPLLFSCPRCSKNLKTVKPGRFRCSECKAILVINDTGQVFLG